MKILLPILLSLFIFSGCAKLVYITEQGVEQVKLQWRGVPNEELLKDPKVNAEFKRKIKLVQEYKKFFYDYFNVDSTSIYSKTTLLENEAVTYLVIASPHTKIEAHEFEFPFMGSFPYIGFFRLDSARQFARKLRKEQQLVTWIRPVYAYSTLGYLEDRILSSFFEYNDIELAELIFHELFHTVFFVKDEVEINENLANLYGRELIKEYFKDREELTRYMQNVDKAEVLNRKAVDLIGILKTEFAKLGGFITAAKADELTQRFISEVWHPELSALREKLGLTEEDYRLKRPWNQAAFAAFMTYEEKQDFLEKLKNDQKLDLKGFLGWLKIERKGFEAQEKIDSFAKYLKQKVSHAPVALD